jgi:hypothetical protein
MTNPLVYLHVLHGVSERYMCSLYGSVMVRTGFYY